MSILFTVGAFIVALGILITVHEFGHFSVARLVGVRVLRFSVGFGRPLLRWQKSPESTEYVLAALPLGGYVKMLDEREEPVPEEQLAFAFNRQALWKRTAVVAAGPVFNLVFAVLVYWAIFLSGDTGLRPVIGTVTPDSIAQSAHFQPGDELISVGDRMVPTWETVVYAFTAEAVKGQDLEVRVRDAAGEERERFLPGRDMLDLLDQPDLVARLGLAPRTPVLPPVIGQILPGQPAEQAGLQVGDRILSADSTPIKSWADWVDFVRGRPGAAIRLQVRQKDGTDVARTLTPASVQEDGKTFGRIGAGVDVPDGWIDQYRVKIQYGPFEALVKAGDNTLDMSVLMLKVVGRMLVGQASVKNLSGPITIAEAAGQTARYGLVPFLKFLAVVSISLGVLNLLPIPVLDGGHLAYFLIEWVRGKPLSENAQMQAQRVGLVVLVALISLSFYVDINRLDFHPFLDWLNRLLG